MDIRLTWNELKNAPMYLFGIYASVLGMTALLNHLLPYEAGLLVEMLSPNHREAINQPFTRYRYLLWAAATITYLLVLPLGFLLKIPDKKHTNRRNIFWIRWILAAAIGFCVWKGYLSVMLCKSCIEENDAIYFILTTFSAVGIQMIAIVGVVNLRILFSRG